LLTDGEDYQNLWLIHEFGLLSVPEKVKAADTVAKLKENTDRPRNKG